MGRLLLKAIFAVACTAAVTTVLAETAQTKNTSHDSTRDFLISLMAQSLKDKTFETTKDIMGRLIEHYPNDNIALNALASGLRDCLDIFGYDRRMATLSQYLLDRAGGSRLAAPLRIIADRYNEHFPPLRQRPVLHLVMGDKA